MSRSTLFIVPPSIRVDLSYRKMEALVAIEQDSRILTLTSLSLDMMQLAGIPRTVLVLFIFGKKK